MADLTRILRLLKRQAQETHEGNKTFPDSGKLECSRVLGFHSMVIQAVNKGGRAVGQGWMTLLRSHTHSEMAL